MIYTEENKIFDYDKEYNKERKERNKEMILLENRFVLIK